MDQVKIFIPLLVIALFLGCNSPKTGKQSAQPPDKTKTNLKGSFSISGAYALYPLIARLADEFMKINPEVKIIAVSGLTEKDKLAKVADSVNAFLSKPYSTEKLLKTTHEVLSEN